MLSVPAILDLINRRDEALFIVQKSIEICRRHELQVRFFYLTVLDVAGEIAAMLSFVALQ